MVFTAKIVTEEVRKWDIL